MELLFSYGPPDLGLLGLGEEALGRGLMGLSKQLGMELKPEQLPSPLRELLRVSEPSSTGAAGQEKGSKKKRESPAARLTLRHDYEVWHVRSDEDGTGVGGRVGQGFRSC